MRERETPLPYQQDPGSRMKGMLHDWGRMCERPIHRAARLMNGIPHSTNCFYDVPFKISISSRFDSF